MEYVPLFAARVRDDDDGAAHLSVGVEINTLCGKENIVSASQIMNLMEAKQKNIYSELCDTCKERWEDISDSVSPETVVECNRCEKPYSERLARCVEHIESGTEAICRPCYLKLLDSDESGVTVPYEDAEPFSEVALGDRTTPDEVEDLLEN